MCKLITREVYEYLHAVLIQPQSLCEQVRWCLHTLFYLLCNNEANQMEAARIPGFEVDILQSYYMQPSLS